MIRLPLRAVSIVGVVMVSLSVTAFSQQPVAKSTGNDSFFSETKVYRIDITVPADEYKAMQPQGGFGPGFFPGGPAATPKKSEDDRETHRNNFGVTLPFAYGSLVADGQSFPKVGIRYKGNGTIMDASNTIKKSFKIDLNRYDEKHRFQGLKTINLNSGVADPSKARETLSYAAYRRAGVPAPRTALAEVTLTVPGKYDKEYLGLYTILESVDKAFLKAHFKNDAGLLFKPERSGGLNFLGEDWERYVEAYQPKRDATPEEQKRFLSFVKLVNAAPDDQFKNEIEQYLDVDEFLRFMSTTALLVNLDSFFTIGHNFLLYMHPDTKKFHFIPWDMDRSFANFGIFGSPEQLLDMSIVKPYQQSRLPDRLLAIPKYRDRHKQILKEVAATFTKERLQKDLDSFEAATKEMLAKGEKAATARREPPPGMGGGPFGNVPEMRAFIDARSKSIQDQLAGKSEGFVLRGGFGFGPPGGGPGRGPGGMGPGGGPVGALAQPLFDSLDRNKVGKVTEAEFTAAMKKHFTEWDKDKSGSLDQRELAEGLQRLIPNPPMNFGPPGGFPGGPRGPGEFPGKGPGGFPGGPQPKGP
jgi:spore coat protein H